MVHFSTPSLRAALGERLFQVAAWACGARQEVLWCRFWWPLEDCTKENGCLWAVPGSHRTPVKRRFKRKADGSGTYFDPPEPEEFCTDGAVPLEIPAGSLVLINNSVVHFSEANTSERSRHAYSIHVVEGGAGYDYPADNWLQRLDGTPFPSLY